MALPQFVKSGVSVSPVTFSRADVFPQVEPRILNQFVGVSDANTVQVAVIGAPLRTFVIPFQQLTKQDRDNALTFLLDPLVNGGEFSFTYIDADSVSHTVRYLEPQIAIPEDSEDNVAWDLVLTEV